MASGVALIPAAIGTIITGAVAIRDFYVYMTSEKVGDDDITIPAVISDDDTEDIGNRRIALGTDSDLHNFAYNPKINAIPYNDKDRPWADASSTWTQIMMELIVFGNDPNTSFHFNLTTSSGRLDDPINMQVHKNSITIKEFNFVRKLYPHKTTFYIKSGTIYKETQPK